VGALLNIQPVSDVIGIQSPDTFVRPIYAGNAILTVKSLEGVKILTIRPTSFEAVPASGGSAPVEKGMSIPKRFRFQYNKIRNFFHVNLFRGKKYRLFFCRLKSF
jgi:electron transfer flavoprotein alpha subunit